MSREVYERLLAECRKEWIVAGNQTFNMDVFAPSSHSTSNPPFNRDTHELLANVNVPMDSDRSCFTLDAFAVMEKVKRTDRTRKVFTRLCNEAGAHLPPEFGTRLCDYCTWDNRGPASRWIALMLYLEGEVACNPDGTYREQLVITQPFRVYVDVIQICRLHTDQPVFPEVAITDGDPVEPAVGNQPEPAKPTGNELYVATSELKTAEEKAENPPDEEYIFALAGDGYSIAGFGESGYVRKLKGVKQIAVLVQAPGQPVPMNELVGASKEERIVADKRSRQPTLDTKAKHDLKERLSEARGELERAQSVNDTVEVTHCQEEIEQLARQLKGDLGLRGKSRDMNDPTNRLRSRICGTLSTAYDTLKKSQPPMNELAAHFGASISAEGSAFIYRPVNKPTPKWSAVRKESDEI